MSNQSTLSKKSAVLSSFTYKLNSLQLEPAYCMRTDCYFIFDKTVPEGCHGYTGVFVKKEDLPRDLDCDLLTQFPDIKKWVDKGRSLAISKFDGEQQDAHQFHLDAAGAVI